MGRKRSFSASSRGSQEAETLTDDDANADLSIAILAKASTRQQPSFVNSIILDSNDDTDGDAHLSCQPNASDAPGPSSTFEEKKKKNKTSLEEHIRDSQIELPGESSELPEKKKSSRKKKSKKKSVKANGEEVGDPNIDGTKQNEKDVNFKVIADDGEDNLEMRKLLRGPRYFDLPQQDTESCYRCCKSGHVVANCKEDVRKRACFVCGSPDHEVRNCPQGSCFICRGAGHLARSCPNKGYGIIKERDKCKLCLRCGALGHGMAVCSNDYDSEDLKTVQCYVCKKYGHLCCVDVTFTSEMQESCFNCGELGHTGMNCLRNTFIERPGRFCFRCGKEGHFAKSCGKHLKDDQGSNPRTPHMMSRKIEHEFEGFNSVPARVGRRSQWDEKSTPLPKLADRWDMDDDVLDDYEEDSNWGSWKKKKKSGLKHGKHRDEATPERSKRKWRKWQNGR